MVIITHNSQDWGDPRSRRFLTFIASPNRRKNAIRFRVDPLLTFAAILVLCGYSAFVLVILAAEDPGEKRTTRSLAMEPRRTPLQLTTVAFPRKPSSAKASDVSVQLAGEENNHIGHLNLQTTTLPNLPAILNGWDTPDWNPRRFAHKFGHFFHYLMGPSGELRADDNDDSCVVPTSGLIDLFLHHAEQGSRLGNSTDGITVFTTSTNNGPFHHALSDEYKIPPLFEHVAKGYKVFSGLSIGTSHPFHRHEEAWILQVQGTKKWWFFPPTDGNEQNQAVEFLKHKNGCDYLFSGEMLPPGTLVALQRPGDVMWVPRRWWHATCALDPWTAAIGAQGGESRHHNLTPSLIELQEVGGGLPWSDETELLDQLYECRVLEEEGAVRDEQGEVKVPRFAYYRKLQRRLKRNSQT